MDNKNKIVMRISSEILNIIEDSAEMSYSDLQGCIEAQVINAYEAGKEEAQHTRADTHLPY